MARILIVDDSTVQRTMLKMFLETGGHKVIGQAGTGLAAIEKYQKLQPDLVILDIVMPDANGISILDQIIHYDRYAKVIMFSSTALKNIIIESIQLGAKSFLVKPVSREKLLTTVNKVLEMEKTASSNLIFDWLHQEN